MLFVGFLGQEKVLVIVRKSTPRLAKSSSLVLIRLVLTEIQRFKNFKINKEMYGHPDALAVVQRSVASRWPYISL